MAAKFASSPGIGGRAQDIGVCNVGAAAAIV
jgi:hypothetical protein